jgi:peptidoglycan/LPS O-acetylase OafA/YrhL
VLLVTVVGRNVDRTVYLILGPAFIAMGLVMMGFMQTDANFFNFGMSTCIVSFVIGLVLTAAGFYAEVAPAHVAAAEESFRRSAPDPESDLHPHP